MNIFELCAQSPIIDEGAFRMCAAAADLDALSEDGDAPVLIAVWRDNRTALELLIAVGANVDVRGRMNCTALHYACRVRESSALGVLIGACADLDVYNDEGDTPAHIACWGDNHTALELLMSADADVFAANAIEPFTSTTELALSYGSTRCVDALRAHRRIATASRVPGTASLDAGDLGLPADFLPEILKWL